MFCYYCLKQPPPGGIRYFPTIAVGICKECGVGVCEKHGHKAQLAEGRFLCSECSAKLGAGKQAQQRRAG